MYAVISDRGRQFRAEPGAVLDLDLADGQEKGAKIELPVLLLADGATVKVGAPYVAGAKAVVEVIDPLIKGDKLRIGKYKRRKHMSLRAKGFRAQYTKVKVVSIG
jgi:large subunit ribosomal protein L21